MAQTQTETINQSLRTSNDRNNEFDVADDRTAAPDSNDNYKLTNNNNNTKNNHHNDYDDDDDDDFVLLRSSNSYTNNIIFNDISTAVAKQKQMFAADGAGDRHSSTTDTEFSLPMEEATDGQVVNGLSLDKIRSFLESDYVPNEFWHLQRDSFIHRSYNEKLLASKNANDIPKRPTSVPPIQDIKRSSFIRHSFNIVRRSFHKGVKKKPSATTNSSDTESNTILSKKSVNIDHHHTSKKNDKDVIGNSRRNNNECNYSDNSSELSAKHKENSFIKKSKSAENVITLNVPLDKVKKGHHRNNSTASCTSTNR